MQRSLGEGVREFGDLGANFAVFCVEISEPGLVGGVGWRGL